MQVFCAIRDREIKVGAGVGDTDALAEQWDGVVKRSRSQAGGGAFASSQLADGEVCMCVLFCAKCTSCAVNEWRAQ